MEFNGKITALGRNASLENWDERLCKNNNLNVIISYASTKAPTSPSMVYVCAYLSKAGHWMPERQMHGRSWIGTPRCWKFFLFLPRNYILCIKDALVKLAYLPFKLLQNTTWSYSLNPLIWTCKSISSQVFLSATKYIQGMLLLVSFLYRVLHLGIVIISPHFTFKREWPSTKELPCSTNLIGALLLNF